MKSEQITPGALCRHFKGNLYQIIGKAEDSETGELMVVYQALYGQYQLYVRPLSSFVSRIDREKYPNSQQIDRFEVVRKEMLLDSEQREKLEVEEEAGIRIKEAVGNEDYEDYREYQEYAEEQEGMVNPHLLAFLEAETYEEKLAVLVAARPNIDDQLINGMAVALDVVIPEGAIKDRYNGFKNCLETFRKYECNRFSR